MSRQYMSAIWYHSSHQKTLAEESKAAHQKKEKKPIATVIAAASSTVFYDAEDYHQKYLLQKHPAIVSALGIKTNRELIESSRACRLNGYVGGYGAAQDLEKEWESFCIKNEDLKHKVLRQCKFGSDATCSAR
ncbi:peptide methionine sulfoxide reductase MsrA-like [Sycon ciliatum]|uniref:peptide methionine sulfoxide reductase MsrA-like n=1 Tax=Sycon ciliatum TaxID=27933 RepID=UPI0020A9F5B9|eukprot:scpid66718/ scgid34907/ Peptide methionine sulfoxide reductase; Ecdysone-induced protein 28/29 kDa; Methionine-S-sulfoxide reductase; Peptide-methionine (S)-S-oxide reductase